ncbi:MAG TPA: hypothetical protein VFJ85_03425 [Acidimicrobiales bacterium]|nr:hypothetical protein [Acidimicrobiales bacterium]
MRKRTHVMLGETGDKGPSGLHSTVRSGDAVAQVGARSGGKVYKSWVRAKNDRTLDALKISTFFPDDWPEDKIRALAMLNGTANAPQGAPPLTTNESSIYPTNERRQPAVAVSGGQLLPDLQEERAQEAVTAGRVPAGRYPVKRVRP